MLTLGLVLDSFVGNYERVLGSWESQTVQQLVGVWGEPHRTGRSRDGKDVYIYTKSDWITARYCSSRFVIDGNDIIVESSYEGSSCMYLYGNEYLYRYR